MVGRKFEDRTGPITAAISLLVRPGREGSGSKLETCNHSAVVQYPRQDPVFHAGTESSEALLVPTLCTAARNLEEGGIG